MPALDELVAVEECKHCNKGYVYYGNKMEDNVGDWAESLEARKTCHKCKDGTITSSLTEQEREELMKIVIDFYFAWFTDQYKRMEATFDGVGLSTGVKVRKVSR